MIPRETIDRIFDAAKIEDVVGSYVSLKKRGANLLGLCPFHHEKTGSFTVSPSKGIYKCFGCGKAGNSVGFIMEIEQCSYLEAIKQLAQRYHITIEERELTQEEKQRQDDRESMFVVNDFANKWFQSQLHDTQEGMAVGMSYLRQRGIRKDIIKRFQLGYSPEKAKLWADAKKAGYQDAYLVNNPDNQIGTGVCLKDEQGRLFDAFKVVLPYDLEADVIQIKDDDYGIYYIDTFDNKQAYNGKTVEFNAMVVMSNKLPENTFIAGRLAMTCCDNDIQLYGHLCINNCKEKLVNKDFVHIIAIMRYEYSEEYNEEEVILYPISIRKIKPLENPVLDLTK